MSLVKTPPSSPCLLRVSEVAARLGVSNRTVWRLASSKQLGQPVYIGRCRRWKSTCVEQFMSSLKS